MNRVVDEGGRRIAPGPPGHFLFGSLRDLRRDTLQFYTESRRQFGDVVRFRAFRSSCWHLLSHPDHIDYVLRENQRNYPKGIVNRTLERVVGGGLLTSEGDAWLRQRRLSQPAFHRQRLVALADTITGLAGAAVERWRPYARQGRSFDVSAEVMRLTLEIVIKTLFSADLGAREEAVVSALTLVREHIYQRFLRVLPVPDSLPTAANRRFLKACAELDEAVYHIIRARREKAEDTGDLFSMLMLARDEDSGEGLSDEQLRDAVMTFIVAGHETTASMLAWVWHLLATHPEAERRLWDELAAVLGGRPAGAEDLPKLQYTKMVIEESMRLYPPAWGMGRRAVEDDEVGGYFIPAQSVVVMLQYVTHRHPDFWERPEEFDPERFTPALSAARPYFAYFPFGGGPRQCIGNYFSVMEAQLILAAVAQHYRMRHADSRPVVPEPSVTLRPHGGMRMLLSERAAA